MNKLVILLLTFVIMVVGSFAGYWIKAPLDQSEYPIVMPLIFRERAVVDYQENTGFLVNHESRKFLRDVTSISWQGLGKHELEQFMEGRGLLYCYYGNVRATKQDSGTEMVISNWPVASRRFTGQFLSGGSITFLVRRRFPSVLNFFFGTYEIERISEIVS